MGFTGPEKKGMLEQFGVALDPMGNVKSDPKTKQTSVSKVFTAGDMTRGQSLIVWAIAEGRSTAAAVDAYLMGASDLPQPLHPGAVALIFASLSWSIASALTRKLALPESKTVSSAAQMLAGGCMLLIASFAIGEFHRFRPMLVSRAAWACCRAGGCRCARPRPPWSTR